MEKAIVEHKVKKAHAVCSRQFYKIKFVEKFLGEGRIPCNRIVVKKMIEKREISNKNEAKKYKALGRVESTTILKETILKECVNLREGLVLNECNFTICAVVKKTQ